jgi:tetratricopeptide (TPR) repeat protein
MAKKAADMKLRAQAGSEARAAIEAAKGSPDADQKKTQVRAWAADALEKMIAHSVAAGELEDARQCLKLLTTRLPETRTEEQFNAIAASVEGLEATKKQQKDAARQANLDAKQREAIAKRMKPIEDDVAKANKRYQDAVRKSRSTTASTKLCEEAIDLYKKAYKALQALLEKNADDAQLADTAATLSKEMHDSAIRAALHAANMLCIQSDYKNAMDWTQRILAFDPDNEEAKAMARTITVAEASASDDWGWGWNIGHIGNTPKPGNQR